MPLVEISVVFVVISDVFDVMSIAFVAMPVPLVVIFVEHHTVYTTGPSEGLKIRGCQ